MIPERFMNKLNTWFILIHASTLCDCFSTILRNYCYMIKFHSFAPLIVLEGYVPCSCEGDTTFDKKVIPRKQIKSSVGLSFNTNGDNCIVEIYSLHFSYPTCTTYWYAISIFYWQTTYKHVSFEIAYKIYTFIWLKSITKTSMPKSSVIEPPTSY